MRVGLIDVDGRHFPNLALMRISAYHKSRGDLVEWWWTDMIHYDVVYMSKIFSDAYSKDLPAPMNADRVIRGGTGYCISLGADGREHYDKGADAQLPPEIERCFPDYSIYPQYDFAVSLTSRGCPRNCPFCHVTQKEGRASVKVADVSDFWNGQKEIKVLDPNITACLEKRDLMRQYRETGAWIDFTQGLDIRLINREDVEDLNRMKIKAIHFAWDNPKDDLKERFEAFSAEWKVKDYRRKTVYILTNFDSTIEEDVFRVNTVDSLGYTPFVMVYDKPHASELIRSLQRWCNNKRIYGVQKDFWKYRKDKDCGDIQN